MRLQARHVAFGVAVVTSGACAPIPPPSPPVVRYVEVPAAPSAAPVIRCPTPGPEPPAPAPVGPGERRVRFAIHPASANLEVDGKEVVWFGTNHVLSAGEHRLLARIDDSSCCDPLEMTVEIHPPPDGDRDAIQTVALSLRIRDAQVRLVGAPENGFAACDDGAVIRDSQPTTIRMHTPKRTTACTFLPGTTRAAVTLDAGRTTTLRWPVRQR
ncbi:MAG: hypothetical protein RIF41_34750 [Polyangiaceae bacterium]